ncbi:MAG TPA: hypothetical protein VJH75_01970 [Patescibacteria group bacterium]|nr:hypothetical protein [Patescibacteria group bacterium]
MALEESVYRHVKRLEGVNNSADIYDNPSWEDIRRDLDANIVEKVDPKINRKEHELLEQIRDFCLEINELTIDGMDNFFRKYSKSNPVLSGRIVEYLKKVKWDRPLFTIASGKESGEVLSKIFGEGATDLDRNSFLVVYQLPVPVAQFWDKGGVYDTEGYRYWGQKGRDIGPDIIEWGSIYREIAPIVWEAQEMKKFGDLKFERLNEEYQHNPKHYYYIWQVTKRPPYRPSQPVPGDSRSYDF